METKFEKTLMEKLKSNNTSQVYSALLKIRQSYSKSVQKMRILEKYSVIELILPFSEHPKFCNISLSIIADICLELSFVEEVIKLNGVKSIIRIMKSLVNDDVKNRACRALGNIAKFNIGFIAVNVMDPVAIILKFLNETKDSNCQKTAVRTVMILGRSLKVREEILKENGIICIAKLLNSPNSDVLICSIKAVANLTMNCSIVYARQLLELEFLKVIVELYSHNEKSIKDHALISLRNLSSQEEIRSGLVKVGAVKLFIDILSKVESYEEGCLATFALCSCLDHIHMWNHNGTDRTFGLKALLLILQNNKFQNIHMHVISSLIPLSYDSNIANILLNLNLLQNLTQILSIFVQKYKCKSFANSLLKPCYNTKNKLILSDLVKAKHSENEISEFNFQVTEQFLMKPDVLNEAKDKRNANNLMFNLTDTCYGTRLRDYPSSFSPTGICSPIRKLCTSPEFNSDAEVFSPPGQSSSSSWSLTSDSNEYATSTTICWSPVVSSGMMSPEPDIGSDEYSFDKEDECNQAADKNGNFGSICSSTSSCNTSLSSGSSIVQCEKLHQKFSNVNNAMINESMDNQDSRKRLKTEVSNTSDYCQPPNEPIYVFKCKNRVKKLNNERENSNENPVSLEPSSDYLEKQTIDYYIILLILQLSFHLDKKPNSQIADKACFTVLIDYLYFIHNPSPKAQIILLNLIQNRYCFEKLVINGFISEIEDRIACLNSSCKHLANFNQFYLNLIYKGKQEAESDYGIGTLSHILVTSEKKCQFQVLCAMSKLVTEKSGLYRLLYQANGKNLLFSFLSDNCIKIRRKSIISLCELYQSLTKELKKEKCCFDGTCVLRTSEICSYKNAFLDITFIVDNGEQILANREKLCKNSEYFSALLSGHFLETNAECVSLPDVSAESLSTIFHFLHGCGTGKYCPYIKGLSISLLLELLSNCDRFLLKNIKAFVEDRLCHQLFPSSVTKIYTKSKVHNSPALTKRALHFALSMSTVEKDVLCNIFEELIDLESSLNVLSDIENLLKCIF